MFNGYKNLKIKSIISVFLISITLSLSFYIHAAKKLKAISIQEVTPINFGIIAGDNGVCTMQSGGVLVGSSGQSCSGIQIPAEFLVGGSNNEILDLSVTGGTAQGVTFSPLIDGSTIITMTASGTSVFVIGELEFNNPGQGNISIPYTFSANYQ